MNHYTEQNALSFNDIKDMSGEELNKLLSVCFHEGKLRTHEIGINNLKYKDIYPNSHLKQYYVTWDDEQGNNEVTVFSLDEKIYVNNDEWSYGIYKPNNLLN